MHDHKIGIGANHWKAARQRSPQDRRIILYLVVPTSGSGVKNELRFFSGFDEFEPEPRTDTGIALRTDMQAPAAERCVERIITPGEVLPCLLA
jgi:hypothetical protein